MSSAVGCLLVYLTGNANKHAVFQLEQETNFIFVIKRQNMEGEVRPLLIVDSNSMFALPWDPQRAKKSGALILVSVALERLAYYAVVMNLFLYLNKGQPEVINIISS